MQVGDIIAFSGTGLVSAAIQLLTFGAPHYSLSHVGIVGEHDGRLRIFEAVQEGVVAVPIQQRLTRFLGRAFHYPLYRKLYSFERDRLNRFLNDALGKPYDLRGAIKAGGWLLPLSKSHKARTDPSSYYCSELVAHALSDCGIYPTGNPSRFSPNSLTRSMRIAGVLQSPERLR